MAPKIVGYGVAGPNEPRLEATLQEFTRLCDEVIICGNNIDETSKEKITSRGFSFVEDNREWGINQWKIKEDFLTKHVSKLKPDLCVCLDMDEVFDKNLTKEGLYKLYNSQFPAFYFFIVNLWDEGYSPDRNFWNIRAWKWNGETKFPRKNLHCGLAPEWTWARAFYSPYILKHYGLKDKERRELKAKRYDKYDPNARFIAKEYYSSLRSNPQVLPFDEDQLHQTVVQYVQDIKQKYIQPMEKKEDFIIIETPKGETAYVPKNKLADYTKQGCKVVGDYNAIEKIIDKINDEVPKETYICGQCGKTFDSKRKLTGHRLHHRRYDE